MNDPTQDDASSEQPGEGEEANLSYESNPKHRDPWQIGKKGSLCEAEVRDLAEQLLADSVLWEGKRYAVHDGKAYCAQEHQPNRWHGYPVGWVEVPPKLVRQWIKDGRISKRNKKQFWDRH